MKIKFTKMHGTGNDFVVIDAIHQSLNLGVPQFRYLADRRFGVGADQILIVQKPESADADFRYRIFNADGGEVEQCGNGARAFVQFVLEKGLTNQRSIKVETLAGLIQPTVELNGLISVDMGTPIFEPAKVPFDTAGLATITLQNDECWPLIIDQQSRVFSVLSMGNPHAVQIVDNVELAAVVAEGKLIECHPRFPKRVNAGFMQILDTHRIRLRVFERGAGETLACGTGACAAVVAGIRRGLLSSPVNIETRGGELLVSWAEAIQSVVLTGPAITVFEGEIEI